MKVFADLHHFDLFHSFQLLFEDRLGWDLYRPIGYPWRDEGYWSLHYVPLIQEGYLGHSIKEKLAEYDTFKDPEWSRHALELLKLGESKELADGYWRIRDESKDRYQKAITLEAFKETKFDIIISSVPWHFPLYEKLRQKYQPQAKHIFQAGNAWEPPEGCKNMMFSSPPPNLPSGMNTVEYHQEFNLDTFGFNPHAINKRVNAYAHFPESEDLMNQVAKHLPDYLFGFTGSHLGPTKDIIIESSKLAEHIGNNTFTWHIKPRGEGYGHILHNSFAVGTPVITDMRDYNDFCGKKLLVDGVTCIDVSNKSPETIAQEITRMSDTTTRQNVYNQFKKVVDFDKEFENIKHFLERL